MKIQLICLLSFCSSSPALYLYGERREECERVEESGSINAEGTEASATHTDETSNSLLFPDLIKPEHLDGKLIQLPKLGRLKLILHRPIPDGFKIKTATISKKADGYYIALSLQDSSVPELSPELPTLDNTVGIDMGLKSFLVDDSGETTE